MAEEIQSGKTDGTSVNSLNQRLASTKSTIRILGGPNAGKTVGLPNGQVVTLRPKQTRISGKISLTDIIVTGAKVASAAVPRSSKSHPLFTSWNSAIAPTRDADLSEEASQKVMAALGEAEAALAGAIAQAKRNTALLHDARLEIETAHAIASSSNRASGFPPDDVDSGSIA